MYNFFPGLERLAYFVQTAKLNIMKKLLLILTVVGLFVAACNNNKGKDNANRNNREKDNYLNNNGDNDKDNNTSTGNWSSAEKQRVLNDCIEEMIGDEIDKTSARNYCNCVLEKTMQKYSSIEKADEMGTEGEAESMAMECLGELTGNRDNNNNDDNTGASWSIYDESRFMSDCEGTARQNVGAQRAREYCDCMLQKVKRIFSSYAEAERGLLQMPKEELDAMADECNGVDN
jgi:uncharacterized lipoprotein NlpE involved in copper resistance